MPRLFRISVLTALLLCGLILRAQEPATIDSEPAVRFAHGGGYFHYAAFCRTPKDYSAQMPKTGLPVDQIEFAIGWYVKASVTRGVTPSSEIDGRIVVSQHHVRFMPANPQNADQYFDIPRAEAELQHSPGDTVGSVRGKDVVVHFQFRKICLTCGAGGPAPAGLNAELVNQEFALLGDTISHFESGWRTTYRLSKGVPTDLASGRQPASVAPTASHPAPQPKPSTPSNPAASPAMSFGPPGPGRADASRPTAAAKSAVATSPAPAALVMPRGKPVKIASGAADGLLVRKVPPQYPLEAKLVRLEGTVVVHAVIDRTGEVSEVNALSGPPLLESAAVDAVKQWQYKPYAMNGQPVDVETTIEVVFALDRSGSVTRVQNARK